MRHRERGVTFLGWILILIPVGMVLYAGIRLTPVYLEYTKIARTLEQVGDEFSDQTIETRVLRAAIEKRFDIEGVNIINKDDVKITKTGTGFSVTVDYFDTVPFMGNVLLMAEFKKTVRLDVGARSGQHVERRAAAHPRMARARAWLPLPRTGPDRGSADAPQCRRCEQ